MLTGLLEYFQLKYESTAVAWKNETGEKKLFSDTYFSIIDGLNTLHTNNNLYVRMAVHMAVAQDEQLMESIFKRYN